VVSEKPTFVLHNFLFSNQHTMYKIFFSLIAMISLSANSFAQTKAPAAVAAAFKTKFATATAVKWAKENAHEYEAEFTLDGAKHSANFSDKGVWLETESIIKFADAPQKVQDAFKAAHKNAKVKAIAKIETAKGETEYEIEMKGGKEFFYSVDGVLIKK
jgi:Putative beta-lactamase-inhibitor-like, PepSY-like